jgi:RNA polymerase sigma-70 factor (sigma-E family)
MGCVGNQGESSAGEDDAAFREYVLARGTALLRMAIMLTGNRADAEDLVQAALAKTYLAWGKINDRAALDAYVRRAMVNTHISWWRRRKLEEFPTDELPDQVVADHSGESDMAEVVRRALDRLPRRMRAAVMLRYFEDMTEPEIAAVLGISLGTVKSTVSRAVARLRIDAELGEGTTGLAEAYLSAFISIITGTAGVYCEPPDSWHYRICRSGTLRRWLRAEHDDGSPADDHVDHALRDLDIR